MQSQCGGIFHSHIIANSPECACERIFEIGQYLAKIWEKLVGTMV